MKKVLFLTNIPSPYRVEFFNELGKICRLTVVFEGKKALDRHEKWMSGPPDTFHCVILNGLRAGREQFLSFKILKYLRKKWDYIIIGMYSTPTAMFAIEYMRIYNIKFIISADGGFIKDDGMLRYYIKKHFISAASLWFSSGNETSRYLVHYGADRNKCFLFPFTSLRNREIERNAKSVNEDKGRIRKYLGISPDCKMVLTVSQIIERKGIDLLVEASKKFGEEVVFIIVGGEKADWLNIKDDKNDNLRFDGFKTKEEIGDYYRAADVFVLPTREDIWGLVVNEAMSYGLPVITTNRCVAGLELIDNGINGYIVEINDIQAIEAAIRHVFIQNSNQEMSNKAIEKIRSYSIENMVKAHMNIIESSII